jgi:hypothetical protein
MKTGIVCFMLACCCVAALTGEGAIAPSVKIVQAPVGCFVPDVVMDAKNVLHIVYAQDRNAYYVQSTDNGATLSQPVQINTESTVEFKMGERGPKLSVDRDGVIHVAWMDCWAPKVKTYVRYARSLNGGKTFEKEKTLSSMTGPDGVTMAADEAGHALVFWHVASPPQDQIPAATWLFTARSDDNGATFKPNEPLKIDNHGGLACSMCMMRARIGADGNVYLVFRSAEKNIRDFYVFKSAVTKNAFTAIRVNLDNWELKRCPMCGPELTVGPDGRQLCAFMSRQRVYWAVSDKGVTEFKLHVATPTPEEDEIYPTALANSKSDVLLVWQIGPMATNGQATVKWARYSIDGKPTGQAGTVGKTTSGTKATAFVGSDDNFYIVTTAK